MADQAPRRKAVAKKKIEDAIKYEAELVKQANTLRGEGHDLTPEVFLKLYPLLCMPIPEGFLETISRGKGKPYDSTGIRSAQVQIDRLNNILRPWWWNCDERYERDGTVCHVEVWIESDGIIFANGKSAGGVNQGSTIGNIYKGSWTNAFKLACARMGIGSEVYLGLADFDPDVSEDAAKAQAAPEELPGIETIDGEAVAALKDKIGLVTPAEGEERERFIRDFKLQLGAMGVRNGSSVNAALPSLTPKQAEDLDAWLAAR